MGKPRVALVLSGGGARGAYEAGVIKYIRNELPEKIAKNIEFDIICGTSVGAINCCYLASSNDAPSLQGTGVAEIWSKLNIEGIYKVGMRELSRIPRFIFGSKRHKHFHFDKEIRRLGGFFDTSPLENLVSTEINWPNIRKNIHEGNLKALAINATHIASGKTHVFVDRFEGGLPPWSTDPHVDAFSVKIGPQHALASAAIPWVFPAVNIAGDLYCDGGVKLNTPISPALRLGADRLFVLGLSPEPNLFMNQDSNLDKNNIESYPSAIYLIGKLLSGLMADKTEYELKRLERFNELIKAGKDRFGQDFLDEIARVMGPLRGASYREVDTFMIRPSEDIAAIAARHMELDNIAERCGGVLKFLLKRMLAAGAGPAGETISYLLFDGQYAQDLIRLGMQDADAKRQQIIDFFS